MLSEGVRWNLMASQPGKQTVAIRTLPNISRGKGNQKIKISNLKFIHKMWWRNYSQTHSKNFKLKYISGSVV